jgi:para-aminobenzoate synthetase component 1
LKKGISFPVDNITDFRIQMLNWVNRFNIFCFLDNRQYEFSKPEFECLVAAGCKRNIEPGANRALEIFEQFHTAEKGEWLFGHLGYDLQNETGKMSSAHFDGIGFSDLHFFVPEIVLELDANEIIIYCDSGAEKIFNEIRACPTVILAAGPTVLAIQRRIGKDDYCRIIEQLRHHILRGDCYEINFCQEFFAEGVTIDPLYFFHRLSDISPNPFAAFYKVNDKYCCCASPERYLKKTGHKIISQPIKGTSKRNLADPSADEERKQYLLQSSKEKSENVMVVDLVRNDLSRICKAGSVKVEELFGLYSFPQVHQMISTVSGELRPGLGPADIFKATFPMGSMTGAPKIKVMQLIGQYESTKRGLFSGAIGYFHPNGDFDFNVVIRSLLYNTATKYLSFQTGGAITFNSNAEKEYEECLLKAEAILSILS